MTLKPFGIDVVIIEPGVIATEFGDVMNKRFKNYLQKSAYAKAVNSMQEALQQIDINRISKPKVITKLVLKNIKAKKPKTLLYDRKIF